VVAKSNILTAAREIESALRTFALDSKASKALVFETNWGHLKALVGCDGFLGVSLGKRQELIWDYLRDRVAQEFLAHLIAVHPMDLDEFERSVQETV